MPFPPIRVVYQTLSLTEQAGIFFRRYVVRRSIKYSQQQTKRSLEDAMKAFDLIECQRQARSCKQPRELFELWEDVCRLYDRRIIGSYELDEMKAVIWPNLQVLSA